MPSPCTADSFGLGDISKSSYGYRVQYAVLIAELAKTTRADWWCRGMSNFLTPR
jgi:hypothetical protein